MLNLFEIENCAVVAKMKNYFSLKLIDDRRKQK